MRITLSQSEISILIGLLDIALVTVSVLGTEKGESPDSIEQAASNLAYDAYEALRLRLLDI